MTDVVGGSVASGGVGTIITPTNLYLFLGIDPDAATATEVALAASVIKVAEGSIIQVLGYDPTLKVRTEYYPQIDFALSNGMTVAEVDGNFAYQRQISGAVSDELQLSGLPIRQSNAAGTDTIDLRIDYDGRNGTRDSAFADETLKIEGTDFWPNYDTVDSNGKKICSDGILRSQGRWPSEAGSVKITYLAGYSAIELDGTDTVIDASAIKEVAISESVRKFKQAYSRLKGRAGHGSSPMTSERLGDYSYTLEQSTFKSMFGVSSDIMPESQLRLEKFINYGAFYAL